MTVSFMFTPKQEGTKPQKHEGTKPRKGWFRALRAFVPSCLLLMSLLALIGCVPPLEPVVSEPQGVLFSEDADPGNAALPFIADELLVQPYPGADEQALSALYAQVGAEVTGQLPEIGMTVLRVPANDLISAGTTLADSGLIEAVQKNYLLQAEALPNDPLFSDQSHLPQINAPQAWNLSVGDRGVILGIVDTGVDAGHPDLAGRIIDGWNVYDDNRDFTDVLGHGTAVAGVAAATSDNGVGVTGVTWDNPIIAVRATDKEGRASARHIAAGILWAAGHGARVINASFAPLWNNRVVQSAAQQAFNQGSIVVISAGNGGGMTDAAGYDEALFVGAVDRADGIAFFSDRGPFVDLVAPGTAIKSTRRGGDYDLVNGTSFAAPIVSGVAALALSVNPDLRPVTIIEAVLSTTVDLGDRGPDHTFGLGKVDALAAVTRAATSTFEPDGTPPTLKIDRPTNGATISGRYTARATATDRFGVADVVMAVDGVPQATDTRKPFQFVLDTNQFAAGRHELSFTATDLAGNVSPARTVSVTFRSSSGGTAGTSVIFRSPASGASVSGDVTIQAAVSDSDGLATAEWFVDGQSAFVNSVSGTSAGVSYLWRTSNVASGSHRITLTVTDANGATTSGTLTLNKR